MLRGAPKREQLSPMLRESALLLSEVLSEGVAETHGAAALENGKDFPEDGSLDEVPAVDVMPPVIWRFRITNPMSALL